MTIPKKYKCRKCDEVVTQHKIGEKPVRSGARDFAGDTHGSTMFYCDVDECPHPVADDDNGARGAAKAE